jgi:hypothetical protein
MAAEDRPVRFKIPEKKEKPVLDENGFQELLAAAYVLQQHNDSVRAKDPAVNTSAVLSEIAEIQSLVRDGGLDIAQAAKLISERLRKITSASGVSISLVTDGYLDCVAESGVAAAIPGSSIASHSLVATEKLRSGEIFESANAFEDIRLSVDICRELGVASLIAAPIHEFGEIAGLVEVRWDRPNAFQESDVPACRLMAGLTTSVIERKSRNSERDGARTSAGAERPKPSESAGAKTAATADAGAENRKDGAECCRVCGRPFGPREAFCGNCSLPRMAVDHSTELQSKWASMWYMQQAQGNLQRRPPAREVPRQADENRPRIPATPAEFRAARPPAPPPLQRRPAPVAARPAQTSPLATPPPTPPAPKKPESRPLVPSPPAGARLTRTPVVPPPEVRRERTAAVIPQGEVRPAQVLVRTSPLSPTSVAVVNPVAAREAKAQTAASVRIAKPVHKETTSQALGFKLRARDAIVASGAILVALVMLVLAATSSNSGMSWFDALLVNLGITQAPAPNQALISGNPEARVWVDVHTGLYYCPGSDLYGKTPGGRFTDQIDAQKDQFEPASRSVCK